MPDNNNKNITSLNLKDLANFSLGKWPLLACMAAVFVIAAYIYSSFISVPLYESTGKLYIMNQAAEKLTSADFSISTYLTKDCENLISDKAVLGEVSKKLGGKYSAGEIKSALSVKAPENTRFIEFTIKTASANDSKIIVDTLCAVAQEKIEELLKVNRVTIIREGAVASAPTSPNVKRNVIAAFLAACLIFAFIIFVSYYFNDKINSPEDVEKYLDISTLGDIPCNKLKARSK